MQPMAGVPKRLTEKQLKFARLYVLNEGRMTATECAIEAGYTKDQEAAYATASRLLNEEKSPLVVQEIGKLRAEMQKKYEITHESHLKELGQLRDESRKNKAWTAATNAEVARGKAGGLYIDRSMHLHKNVSDLSEEELDKKVIKSLKRYGKIFDAEVIEAEESE